MDGLLRAKFAYPSVNFRYAISPSQSLPSALNPFSLSTKQIQAMIQLGINDAKNAISKGEGTSVEHLIHYHSLKVNNDERIQKMSFGQFLEAKESGLFEKYESSSDPSFIKYKLME